jgi:hypothetical protein
MTTEIKVFILSEEVDIIGVYYTFEEAQNDVEKYDLLNWTIIEKTLKGK